MKKITLAALLACAFVGQSFATPLEINGANSQSEGDCTFACVTKYQQVYDNALFGNSLVTINSVDFLGAYSNPWGANNSYRLTIGVANGGVNNLSSTFASNFQSSAVFETKSFAGATNPGDWFGFDGAYVYDPLAGDLLIDIERIAGIAGGPGVQYTWESGGEFSRVYEWSNTNNGSIGQNYGNTTRFEVNGVQANVPEPASLALFGLGLAALCLRRRKA